MAVDGITPAGTNPTPELNQVSQNEELAANQNDADLTADNRAVSPSEDLGESRNDTTTTQDERSEQFAPSAESRTERENEVEFRNSDGDSATITRQGREASQITANQPV